MAPYLVKCGDDDGVLCDSKRTALFFACSLALKELHEMMENGNPFSHQLASQLIGMIEQDKYDIAIECYNRNVLNPKIDLDILEVGKVETEASDELDTFLSKVLLTIEPVCDFCGELPDDCTCKEDVEDAGFEQED